MNYNELVALLGDGACIEITTDIDTNGHTLALPYEDVTLWGTGQIRHPDPTQTAVQITGVNTRIVGLTTIGGVDVWTGMRTRLRDMTIRYRGSFGVRALQGAGLWTSGLHVDGGGIGGAAFYVDYWDTFFSTDDLVEEPLTGYRLKGVGNTRLLNPTVDRCRSVGYHFEPGPNQVLHNLQVSNLWGSGLAGVGRYPMLRNGTDGPLVNEQGSNLYFTDFIDKFVSIFGSAAPFINCYTNVIHA